MEMRKYCVKRNWPDVYITVEELKAFVVILIVSGYNPLSQKPLFWSKSLYICCVAVSNALRRDRFDTIMKCLHFNADNKLDKSNKFNKLRSLIQHLQIN